MMRLKRISVKYLFGIYEHEIDFSNDNVTLLLGDNGVGKSTIFKFVNAFFKEDYASLLAIEFGVFEIELMDGSIFVISRDNNEEGDIDLFISFIKPSGEESTVTLSIIESTRSEAVRKIRRYFPKTYRTIDDNRYRDTRTHEEYSIDEVVEKLQSIIPETIKEQLVFPLWLKQEVGKVNMVYVGAQRVLTPMENKEAEDGAVKYKNTLSLFSEDLCKIIAESINAASRVASELDSTYPKRLMACFQNNNISTETIPSLSSKLKEIEEKQQEYARIGLLPYDSKNSMRFSTWHGLDRRIMSTVLSTYIHDMERKLSAYEHIYMKLSLFSYLANGYLQDKKLTIDSQKGFIIKSDYNDNKVIEIDRLSSGEQNILILFYDLIFKAEPESVLLFDEPEISLHVVWQRRFIDDLLRVIQINPIQVCVATHSPSLINAHWNITQEIMTKDNG